VEEFPEISKTVVNCLAEPDTTSAGGNAENEGAAVDRSGSLDYIAPIKAKC
jgi:hypothetical protein